MKIRRVSLRNFQSHENSDIRLDDFNVIVGLSSSGKSSIIRALEWLFYGDWDKTYPRDAEKESAVAIQLDDGRLIARFRNGNKQRAAIKTPDGKVTPFKDFGEHIPGIFDMINLRPIEVGTKKVNLNFSRQDDPAFMIHDSWSKPAKAQWIGRLYGAHVINKMLRLMNADKRDLERDKRTFSEEEESLREEIVKYKDLDGKLEALREAKMSLARLGDLSLISERKQAILVAYKKLKESDAILSCDTDKLRKAVTMLDRAQKLSTELSTLYAQREQLVGKLGVLKVDTKEIRSMLERLQYLRDARSKLDSINTLEGQLAGKESLLGMNTDSIRDMLNKLTDLKSIQDRVQTVGDPSELESRINKISKSITKMRGELKEDLLKNGKCPLCSSKKKIDPATLSDNLKQLIGA